MMRNFLKPIFLGVASAFGAIWLSSAAMADSEAILTFEPGKEYPGAAYQRLEMGRGSPGECRQICLENSDRCKAFTYYRPGAKSEFGVCELKTEKRPLQNNSNVFGGSFTNINVPEAFTKVSDQRFSAGFEAYKHSEFIDCPTSAKAFSLTADGEGWERSYGSVGGNTATNAVIANVQGFHLGKHLRCYYEGGGYVYRSIPEDFPECIPRANDFICYPADGPVDYSATIELVAGDSVGVNFEYKEDRPYYNPRSRSEAQLWLSTVDNKAYLLPNDIRLAKINSGPHGPSPDVCAARLGESNLDELETSAIREGDWFCYFIPNSEAFGRFRVDMIYGSNVKPDKLVITYDTWNPGNTAHLLPLRDPAMSRVQAMVGNRSIVGVMVQSANNAESFVKPMLEGYRVDWCLNFGNTCGEAAADKFCQIKGFRTATDFPIARDIGRTKTIGDKRVCDDPGCDGFSRITCQ